jgi:hypothetical protein
MAAAERGSTVAASVAAFGIALYVFTLLAQFAVWQYGRGAVRSAAQEAARAGALLGADAADCRQRFDEVRRGLLGGAMGEGVGPVACRFEDGAVVVRVEVRFTRWVPVSPDWSFQVTAVAVSEGGW